MVPLDFCLLTLVLLVIVIIATFAIATSRAQKRMTRFDPSRPPPPTPPVSLVEETSLRAETSDPATLPLRDLYATMRQLRRWQREGRIDAVTHERLLALARHSVAEFNRAAAETVLGPSLATDGVTTDDVAPESPSIESPPSDTTPTDIDRWTQVTTPHETAPTILASSGVGPTLADQVVAAEIVDAQIVGPTTGGAPPLQPSIQPPFPRPISAATVHPLDRPPEPEAPRVPSAPRRALADVLQAFMEERNIRWGEIISGVLIVVSAVGLVVSLRATLQNTIPYFPALLFLCVTAGIHVAGHYSLRRWNLKSTSRGVLIIGTLLIPLNFLASILLSGDDASLRPVTDPWFVIALVVGVGTFSFLLWKAAAALLRHGRWHWALAMLGPSLAQVLIHRLAPATPTLVSSLALLAIPAASFLAPSLHSVWVGRKRQRATKAYGHRLLLDLGLAVYALLVPAGLLIVRAADRREALACLSPLVSLLGAVLVSHGLLLYRRWNRPDFATLRTTGLALVIQGAVTLLVSLALAWPDPSILLSLGVVNFVLVTLLAIGAESAGLHAAAVASLAVASLVGFHRWRDPLEGTREEIGRRLIDLTFTGPSAMALLAFASIFAIVSFVAGRIRGKVLAQGYAIAAASAIVVSLALTLVVGFGRGVAAGSDTATVLLALFTLLALELSWRRRHAVATVAAATLLGLTLVHACMFHSVLRDELILRTTHPLLAAGLLHLLLLTSFAVNSAIVGWMASREWSAGRLHSWRTAFRPLEEIGTWWPDVVLPSIRVAQLVSIPTFAGVLFYAHEDYFVATCCTTMIGLVWFVSSRLEGRAAWVTATQILSAVLAVFATATVCEVQSWWQNSLLDIHFLSWLLVTLAAWSIASKWTRRLMSRWARRFPDSSWPCEEFVPPLLALALVALSVAAVAPSVVAEWSGLEVAERIEHWHALLAPARLDVRLLWVGVFAILAAVRVCVPRDPDHAAGNWLWITTLAPPMLAAAPWMDELAGASALRWYAALFATVWCAVLCWPRTPFSRATRDATIVVAILAIVGLTTVTIARMVNGDAPVGPADGVFFRRIGSAASYGVPLGLLALQCLAFAMRFRQPTYAIVGQFVTCFLAVLVSVIPMLKRGEGFDATAFITLMYWLSGAQAAYGIAWRAAFAWIEPVRRIADRTTDHSAHHGTLESIAETKAPSCADQQTASQAWYAQGALFHLSVIVQTLAIVAIVVSHGATLTATQKTIASPLAAIVSLLCGVYWFVTLRRRPLSFRIMGSPYDGLIAWNVSAIPILAVAVDVLANDLSWPNVPSSFAILELGWLVVALLAAFRPTPQSSEMETATRWLSDGPPIAWGTRLWGLAFGIALTVFVLVGWIGDFDPKWRSLTLVVGLQMVAVVLAYRERRRLFAFLSLYLPWFAAILIVTMIWPTPSSPAPIDIASVVLLCGVAWTAIWLSVERVQQMRGFDGLWIEPSIVRPHRFGAWGGIVLSTLTMLAVLWSVASSVPSGGLLTTRLLLGLSVPAWLFLAAHLALHVASLWDRRSTTSLMTLYLAWWPVWLAITTAARLDVGNSITMVVWLTVLQTLAACFLWNRGIHVSRWAERMGLGDHVENLKRTSSWLPLWSTIVLVGASTVACLLVLERDVRAARTIAALIPLGAAFGVGFLAQLERQQWAPHLALMLAALAGVLTSWADLPAGFHDPQPLRFAIRALMGLVGFTVVYAIVARRVVNWPAIWIEALHAIARVLAASAIAVLLGMLLLEAVTFQAGASSELTNVEVLAGAIALLGLAAGLLGLAVWPDAPTRSERSRMACVYGAQLVLALLFAHIYLSRQEWFDGELRHYWPYIVVAIAFGGVAVGELLQRLGSRVLAEPFQRSGMLLAIVPALGWWIASSRSDYALLLFLIGMLYVLTSVLRRSWWSRVGAALAGNGALWAMLQKWDGFSIADHPQLWLVPPAASVLVAAHWNRRSLTPTQAAGIRYAAMAVIYLSSTCELFITGIGESLWPPLILLSLSLIGVFVGIATRVRAFLYLGAIFVLLSLVAMVWHASRSIEHVWPWWAFGICSGLLILMFFGLFEKKRPEMVELVRRLREWDG